MTRSPPWNGATRSSARDLVRFTTAALAAPSSIVARATIGTRAARVARSVVKKFMRVAHSNSSSAAARKPSSWRRTAPDVVDQRIDPTVLVHRSLHQRTRRPMRSVHSVPQSAL
jgi:hypothetical protein